MNPLLAISPLDGRYRSKLEKLAPYFSEWALIQYRVRVEIEYFVLLHKLGLPQLKKISEEEIAFLRKMYQDFSIQDAQRIKGIERVTNHDVKAVEYFIKEKIDENRYSNLKDSREFVHFGLTSQDVNNTAVPLSLKEALVDEILPTLEGLIAKLEAQATDWKGIPMLARTHGQPASPTSLGKEFSVFVHRLRAQFDELKALPIPAKFGGATGNFNAHFVAWPQQDWQSFGDDFVENILGLSRSQPTTQIEWYDGLARIFDCLRRINVILTDLSRDIWHYISINYFKQKLKTGEVGSSAMPHKVNPIDFENAEGNLGISTALLEFLSRKLPVSRLQRDLTDSTVLRNLGVAFGHHYLALQSLDRGLGKLLLNPDAIASDLDSQWAVLAEAIQTILRREAYPNPYEALKALTRGNAEVTQASLAEFIQGLNLNEELKIELLALRPENYLGDAGK